MEEMMDRQGLSSRRRLCALARQLLLRRSTVAAVPGGTPRTVKDGDHIRVQITGACKEDGKNPGLFKDDLHTFVCGNGPGIIRPALDEACRGLRLDETKEFAVLPTDECHPSPTHDESLVVELATGGFEPKIGQTVRISYQGEPRPATVVSVQKDKATVDMNDPIAGKTLLMKVQVKGFDVDTSADRRQLLFPDPSTVPDTSFGLEELKAHNGTGEDGSVYISLLGFVYDVTSGPYGPGGTYGHMAGSDATLAMAKFSMSSSLLNKPWSDLDEEGENMLAQYVRTFQGKYPCIGKLKDGAI